MILSSNEGGIMKRTLVSLGLAMLMGLSGCTTVGTMGMMSKSSLDPIAKVQKATIKDLGPAQGEACRYFLLAVLPWGKSDMQAAVDNALSRSGGDALINVAVSSGLYGFIPIYNVFSYTCTRVSGTAVKFVSAEAERVVPSATPSSTPSQTESAPHKMDGSTSPSDTGKSAL
jgi:hypothetical protein